MSRAASQTTRTIVGVMLGLCVELSGSPFTTEAWGQSQPLTIADLAAYRAALQPSHSAKTAPVPKVTFRDLWNHPERFRGNRVQVEGKLARRFRQGKVGEFPPLVENWVFSAAGEPLCFVHPEPEAKQEGLPKLGDMVRFEGTYLRTISYQGSDVARLAPLIVGSAPLSVTSTTLGLKGSSFRKWSVDWPFGLAVAAVVALVLGRQHLKGAFSNPPRRPIEPPPEFVEGSWDSEVLARHRTEESDPT